MCMCAKVGSDIIGGFNFTSFVTDARREGRKAFLAFSANDAKTQLADSEPIHDNSENYSEQHASDDVRSSQNTPVSNLFS